MPGSLSHTLQPQELDPEVFTGALVMRTMMEKAKGS